jgi:hypothetical protein
VRDGCIPGEGSFPMRRSERCVLHRETTSRR